MTRNWGDSWTQAHLFMWNNNNKKPHVMEAVSWSSTTQVCIVIGIHIFHFRSSLVMACTWLAGCGTKDLALVIGCVSMYRGSDYFPVARLCWVSCQGCHWCYIWDASATLMEAFFTFIMNSPRYRWCVYIDHSSRIKNGVWQLRGCDTPIMIVGVFQQPLQSLIIKSLLSVIL